MKQIKKKQALKEIQKQIKDKIEKTTKVCLRIKKTGF